MKRLLSLTALAVAALLLSGSLPVSAETVEVTINDFFFEPANITINAGDTVRWENLGSTVHTSTSGTDCTPDNQWDSGLLSSGQTFSRTFDSAGTFPFYCRVSNHCSAFGMEGVITVEESRQSMLPMPQQMQTYMLQPADSPVSDADPMQAVPIGVGPFAEGGSTIRIQVETMPFAGPTDIYFLISTPDTGGDLLIMQPDLSFAPLSSAGLVPVVSGVTEGLNARPFADLSPDDLTPGPYNIMLGAAPAGETSRYHLWIVSLTVP